MSVTLSWIDDLVQRFGFRRSKRLAWTPPNDDDFLRLETLIGGKLPDEYRYFLHQYGSTILGDEDFEIAAPIVEPCPWGVSTNPEYFHALRNDDPDSVEERLRTYKGRIPKGVLAIVSDAGGNEVCLDVAGEFPGSVWFWDHEQRWFKGNINDAGDELQAEGQNARTMSVHDIIRGWARLHPERCDRPPDYMGMYRMASTFADFLRSLHQVRYE